MTKATKMMVAALGGCSVPVEVNVCQDCGETVTQSTGYYCRRCQRYEARPLSDSHCDLETEFGPIKAYEYCDQNGCR